MTLLERLRWITIVQVVVCSFAITVMCLSLAARIYLNMLLCTMSVCAYYRFPNRKNRHEGHLCHHHHHSWSSYVSTRLLRGRICLKYFGRNLNIAVDDDDDDDELSKNKIKSMRCSSSILSRYLNDGNAFSQWLHYSNRCRRFGGLDWR